MGGLAGRGCQLTGSASAGGCKRSGLMRWEVGGEVAVVWWCLCSQSNVSGVQLGLLGQVSYPAAAP